MTATPKGWRGQASYLALKTVGEPARPQPEENLVTTGRGVNADSSMSNQ